MPPLPKGALLAGGKRLAPTEADSGDRVLRQQNSGGFNSALCTLHSVYSIASTIIVQ